MEKEQGISEWKLKTKQNLESVWKFDNESNVEH